MVGFPANHRRVVDPADSTGNTVYTGEHTVESGDHRTPPPESHGNASAVTWTSLTDNQATLAVGSAGSYRVIVTATEGSGGTALSKALGFNSLPSS